MLYEDIKSYYQKNYEKSFIQLIDNYEKKNFQSVVINSVEVKSVRFNNEKEKDEYIGKDYLKIEILASISNNNRIQEKKYEIKTEVDFENPEIKWIGESRINECNSLEFHESTFYEEYMIRALEPEEIEGLAETIRMTDNFLKNKGFIKEVQEMLGRLFGLNDIEYMYEELPEDTLGRLYLRDGELIVDEKDKKCVKKINKNTIVINSKNKYMDNDKCYEFVIAHEITHKRWHKKYFRIRSLLEDDLEKLDYRFDFSLMDETWTNKQKADWMIEWQANMFAFCICIPKEKILEELNEVLKKGKLKEHILEMPQLMEDAIERIASRNKVPFPFVKYRALQLGYDMALGTFISANNQNWDPIYFPKGTLNEGQTFIIDKQNLEKVCLDNVHLKEELDTGKLIYLGYVVAKNDKKYVERINTDSEREKTGYGYRLTDYGKAHADECCIKFFKEEKEKFPGITYNKHYLNAAFSAESETHHYYDPSFSDNQSDEDLKRNIEKYKSEVNKIIQEKKTQEYQNLVGFSDYLKYHMKKKNISISELADRTYLSETTIKKYRKNVTPTFRNLMAIFIGLNLHAEFCLDMMNVSGLQFKRNDLEHILFQKLIRDHTDGNIHQWNRILKCNKYSEIPDRRGKKETDSLSM